MDKLLNPFQRVQLSVLEWWVIDLTFYNMPEQHFKQYAVEPVMALHFFHKENGLVH